MRSMLSGTRPSPSASSRRRLPIAFDVGGATLDLTVDIAPSATAVDLFDAVAGGPVPTGGGLFVDDRLIDLDQLVDELGLRAGSRLSLTPPTPRVCDGVV